MYDIKFTNKANKQFLNLEKNIQERIGSVLERIKIRPERFVERLVGMEGYKLRVGDYRLILDIQRNKLVILVLRLGHRRNVYKN